MSIGAKDRIDKLLVKKYAQQQVDNHELGVTAMVSPEKMMDAMNDYAAVHRNIMFMSNRITDICAGLKAKSRYSEHLQARAS